MLLDVLGYSSLTSDGSAEKLIARARACVCVCVFEPTSLCLRAAELKSTQQQDAKHLLHLPHEGGHPLSNVEAGDVSNKHGHHISKTKLVLFSSKIVLGRFDPRESI